MVRNQAHVLTRTRWRDTKPALRSFPHENQEEKKMKEKKITKKFDPLTTDAPTDFPTKLNQENPLLLYARVNNS